MKEVLRKELEEEFPELADKALELWEREKLYCPPFALAWAYSELGSWSRVEEAIQVSKKEEIPLCTAVRMLKK